MPDKSLAGRLPTTVRATSAAPPDVIGDSRNAHRLMDKEKLRSFLLIAQDRNLGGFCKIPEESPGMLRSLHND
ncbi:hypothetical protein KIN20_004041 [Parelaphostrongylus tenuis]|uniref:Uncharacterized protein n=1 Tax=Parelaphostrongylus tenuis TaxID=148309 RepID=A0AAD5QE64_PARTN|nr:hypothetical protein KIN20_004041 [Parelaphostrongylus tenuis]